jgi:hypothetical protein
MPISSLRSFFVGDRGDDEGRIEFFQDVSEPNEITVSPTNAPIYPRGGDLKLKKTSGPNPKNATRIFPFRST